MNASLIRKIFVYSALYLFTFGILYSTIRWSGTEQNDFPIFRMIIISFASALLLKYFVYMVLSPWYDFMVYMKYGIHRPGTKGYKTKVSVIVPAWNEEVGLLLTIQTLLKSTYKNLEIVIVNDGSTDNSHTLMSEFVESYERETRHNTERIEILYYYKENEGKGAALNSGIELSHGEIIVSIDADCLVMPDTIENFVKYFRDPTVMAAVGNVKIGNTKNIIGVVQYLEFLFSFYFKKASSLMNTIYIIGGAAGAFRREIFLRYGGYSTKNITEDIELSMRIQDVGMKIVYAADAVVYTEGASDIEGLMTQRLRWKRGRFETFHNYRHMFFSSAKKHTKLLTYIVLPLAIFEEIQLLFELFFVVFLYTYSFVVRDFSSFVSGMIVVSSMFFVQIFFDDKNTKRASFYILAPIGWMLFYVSTFVEYSALVKSIWGYYKNQEITWQRWRRQGVVDNSSHHVPET